MSAVSLAELLRRPGAPGARGASPPRPRSHVYSVPAALFDPKPTARRGLDGGSGHDGHQDLGRVQPAREALVRPTPLAEPEAVADTPQRERRGARESGNEPAVIVVRPTAPRRLMTGRYSLAAAREAWEAERQERQARTLKMLRDAFEQGERTLVGWPAIVLCLHQLGVRNAYGKGVTAAAIRRWRERFNFPLLPGRWKRTPPLSSNYLILAWLVNLMRSGEPDGVRIAKVERVS